MPSMYTKFDTKSARVKGLCFHPVRPWVLSSLHSGAVQLWDYQVGVLIEKFEEHEGPVRGVDFHNKQPLFVSGGDDYKIKVWNYQQRKCMFTLLGHLDYIRTVQFHHEYPWIVSASDDQTIRIWNWQSRSCVSVLTGHNHYVMCAQFHPKDDLIVSASLDQTVRVWDTSELRKKTVRSGPMGRDLFGAADTIVKYVLEGHDRGVNWASFHPSQPLIVSGADDRSVKIWRMDFSKAWEVDTLRGHVNNVSCVLFHPKHDLIISDSEDKSIRVWDSAKRIPLHNFRRENDRFWILAAHPHQNLLAAGHDSGLLVFKLDRERPAFTGGNGQVYYVKDRFLRRAVTAAGSNIPLFTIRKNGSSFNSANSPRFLLQNRFNPSEENIIIFTPSEGGTYDLYNFNSNSNEPIHGSGLSVAFVSRSRYVTLSGRNGRVIDLRDMHGTSLKQMPAPYPNADQLFQAGTSGRVMIRAGDKIGLFETGPRRIVHELQGVSVRYTAWNQDSSQVALIGKHTVVVADKELKQVCSVHETVRVKGAVWDDSGILVYLTANHIKYLIPSKNETGIIRTIEKILYPVEINDNTLHALDRTVELRQVKLDMTECRFKQALISKNYSEVLKIIESGRLCGKAVTAYLRKAGFAEVALMFVEDNSTRFDLSLECGDMQNACDAAQKINSKPVWTRLANAALRLGEISVVEHAYSMIDDKSKLSFLYAITGQFNKLGKLNKKIGEEGTASSILNQFQNALVLGNAEERVNVLSKVGLLPLAYMCSLTHGMHDSAEKLKGYLEEADLEIPSLPSKNGNGNVGALLFPPLSTTTVQSWPKKGSAKSFFDEVNTQLAERDAGLDQKGSPEAEAANVFADAGDQDKGATNEGTVSAAPAEPAWGEDLDLGLEEEEETEVPGTDKDAEDDFGTITPGSYGYSPPEPGKSFKNSWMEGSVPSNHVAAGSFRTAMELLNRQLGIVNFDPLRSIFFSIYEGGLAVVPSLPGMPGLPVTLTKTVPGTENVPEAVSPFTSNTLRQHLQEVYNFFEHGKFADADTVLDKMFRIAPFVNVESEREAAQIKEIISVMSQYKTALLVELTRKTISTDTDEGKIRQLELAAYLTHCNLQPKHVMLTLNLAMSLAFKLGNYINAAGFARRLKELPDASHPSNSRAVEKANKVISNANKKGGNAFKDLNYDEDKPFMICPASLTPIYPGEPSVKSPYSGASYKTDYKGQVCKVDGMAKIGEETIGLVLI
eukprot:gb/GECG01013707.1/.p1 GENE.gb/GECG01013707.1/~~gb/GECG01013707.1/.p1  ORF type:complete len:1232 (+),score=158.46 gb/GECG01013707.1/:1-3696(+)